MIQKGAINKLSSIGVLVLFLISCSSNTVDKNTINSKSSIFIKDYFNRNVYLTKPAQRIIPIYYGECEIITALGAKDRIVGVGLLPDLNNKSCSYILERYFPKLAGITSVGYSSINLEKIIQLKPDLVIIDNRVDLLNQMNKLGITTIAIFPKRFDDIIKSVNLIGKIVNKEQNAKILTDTLSCLLTTIRTKTRSLSINKFPTTYYIWNDLYTTVNDSVQNEILEICGSTNVLKNNYINAYSLTISLEILYKLDPDFIIIRDRSNLTVDDLLNDKRLKNLKAIYNRHVYKEHSGWRGYKIETFYGMIEKSKWFHSELFKDMNPDFEYTKFIKMIEMFNK